MITINDVTYEESDLTPEAINNVKRVNELRQELNGHQMRSSELNVLISAYANAIKDSVEEESEEDSEGMEVMGEIWARCLEPEGEADLRGAVLCVSVRTLKRLTGI